MQVNWDKELDEEAERQRRRKKENSEAVAAVLPPVKKPEVVPQLPKPRSSVSPKLGRTKESSAILDLLGLGKFLILYAYNLKNLQLSYNIIINRCTGN